MRKQKSLTAALARRDTELLELFVTLFSLRFAVTLITPIFNSFTNSTVFSALNGAMGTPLYIVTILFGMVIAWIYGFYTNSMVIRVRTMLTSIYFYTFMTIALIIGDFHKSAWTIYGLVATAAALCFARLRRDSNGY